MAIRMGFEHHQGLHGFAPFVVRHTNDGHFLHGRMPCQHRFNFGGINVFAAADDHVAFAVHQPNESVRVTARHVTHRTPCACVGLVGFFRCIPIAFKCIGRA